MFSLFINQIMNVKICHTFDLPYYNTFNTSVFHWHHSVIIQEGWETAKKHILKMNNSLIQHIIIILVSNSVQKLLCRCLLQITVFWFLYKTFNPKIRGGWAYLKPPPPLIYNYVCLFLMLLSLPVIMVFSFLNYNCYLIWNFFLCFPHWFTYLEPSFFIIYKKLSY